MENKKKREEKVLQSLPLLKYRTFGQMRKYYKITKNTVYTPNIPITMKIKFDE